jgi:predicted nucleic acid-binding protein
MNADFLDSNIFVYLFDETDERRSASTTPFAEISA